MSLNSISNCPLNSIDIQFALKLFKKHTTRTCLDGFTYCTSSMSKCPLDSISNFPSTQDAITNGTERQGSRRGERPSSSSWRRAECAPFSRCHFQKFCILLFFASPKSFSRTFISFFLCLSHDQCAFFNGPGLE